MMATEIMEPQSSDVSVLHRVSRIVSSELSLDEMLGEIVGLTSQVTGCDACLVYLVEQKPANSCCAPRWCRTPRIWDICA